MQLESLSLRYNQPDLFILDQQRLPHEETWLPSNSIDTMCEYIKDLKVRGAPLIGLAALCALDQYAQQGASIENLTKAIHKLIATRPTAVNLRNYMERILQNLSNGVGVVSEITRATFMEDVALCDQMAHYGLELLAPQSTVITYCNTGALATAGVGTALGVIKEGFKVGKIKHVYVCETRPLFQGGRLTAWELEKAGVPHTLICDNMAATLMQQGKISACLVGADRIAINGDTANKIGTYNMAVLSHFHKIPFYVVAPFTTLDKNCSSAADIVIEERHADEIKGAFNKVTWVLKATPVYNPSFDITPGDMVTRFIFDSGIFSADQIKTFWE